MPRIFISVGRNIEPEKYVRAGVEALRKSFSPLVISRVYESEAVGFRGDNFLNLVVEGCSDGTPHAVAAQLRDIEAVHARDRRAPRFSARTLDLDLLLYDDLVLFDPSLQLPRAEIIENAFVLGPLAEIAPSLKHPLCDKTYAVLWREFDQGRQPIWAVDFEW